jgi:uncharacterized protein with von Willebrand factor type A (vWA) domain
MEYTFNLGGHMDTAGTVAIIISLGVILGVAIQIYRGYKGSDHLYVFVDTSGSMISKQLTLIIDLVQIFEDRGLSDERTQVRFFNERVSPEIFSPVLAICELSNSATYNGGTNVVACITTIRSLRKEKPYAAIAVVTDHDTIGWGALEALGVVRHLIV